MNISITLSARIKKYWCILGPGLITDASNDDPSGISTYSQAGAGSGFATLWTAIITFPLMAVVQQMKRGQQLVGVVRGYIFSVMVSVIRPATDYTARVIPNFDSIAVPLEVSQILWQPR
jgi:hypothetical protein